jgi:putative hydrolase of the HAD superfamily
VTELSGLRAVTFDCWGTLLYEPDPMRSFGPRVDAVVETVAGAGTPIDSDTARAALDAAWHRHVALWQEGQASGASEIATWTLDALGLQTPELAESLGLRLGDASLGSEVIALDGAREALARLAQAGIRRALVCDTGFTPGHTIRELLDRQGLLEHLEVCIFSDEAGVPKPHPSVFQAALEPLGARPEESAHVGDLRRTDVAGARGFGMRSIRIRWHHDDQSDHAEADTVVNSHAHLLELMGLA